MALRTGILSKPLAEWLNKRRQSNTDALVVEVLKEIVLRESAPVVVKVGANDGITGDPCGDHFLKNKRWSGVFVEPVPFCMDRLRSNYDRDRRFVFEEVAIGLEEATKSIFYLSDQAKRTHPDLPDWFDQLGSFEKDHIEKHFGPKLNAFIVERKVEAVRLQTVLNRNLIQLIDFLQIDTEGHDLNVLKTLDFELIQPRVILVEHKHLSRDDKAELKSLLVAKGYRIQNLGHDYLATRDH